MAYDERLAERIRGALDAWVRWALKFNATLRAEQKKVRRRP